MVVHSLIASGLAFIIWAVVLWRTDRLRSCLRQTRCEIRRPHAVQLVLQLTIYGYWSLYWDEVARRASLIFAQVVFAYLFEMLLSWSRGKAWHLRLAPLPIVFSLNLFLWFRDEYFYLQLLLIVAAYLAKEFITWEREGRRGHVFNPSAFPLAVASLTFLGFSSVTTTYGLDLIWSFTLPPHFYEVIFLLGLVVQFLFSTTLITLGATTSLVTLHVLSRVWLGGPYAPHPFDAAVFLGVTLLVTDPATSPRTGVGKLLFGLIYGAGIVVTYLVLRFLSQPTYFDKILVVPVVNLLVPWCDAAARTVRGWRVGGRSLSGQWSVPLATYVGFFLAIVPMLKDSAREFRDPLPPPAMELSPAMRDVRTLAAAYRFAYPEVFAPFAFELEYRHYRRPSQFVPHSAHEFVALGRALLDARSPDRAIDALRWAVHLDGQSADAHRYLGEALWRARHAPAAVQELQIATDLAPDDAEAQLHLGLALGAQGRDEQAVVHLRRSVELMPDDFFKHLILGTALLKTRRLNESVTELRRAVALNPDSGLAHLQLGNALLVAGFPQEGQLEILRAQTRIPPDVDLRRQPESLAPVAQTMR